MLPSISCDQPRAARALASPRPARGAPASLVHDAQRSLVWSPMPAQRRMSAPQLADHLTEGNIGTNWSPPVARAASSSGWSPAATRRGGWSVSPNDTALDYGSEGGVPAEFFLPARCAPSACRCSSSPRAIRPRPALQRLLPDASHLFDHPSLRLVGTHQITVAVLDDVRERPQRAASVRMAVEQLQQLGIVVNARRHRSRSGSAAAGCSVF